jgi:ankyrin repeat protein
MKASDKLINASSIGDLSLIRRLLNAKVLNLLRLININGIGSTGITPLIAAIEANQVEAVRLLVNMGANVNKADIEKMIPLIHALLGGNKKIIKILATSGADVNIVSPISFILWAKTNKSEVDTFPPIFGHSFNPLIKENMSRLRNSTPLFLACYKEYFEIAKYLIESGADVNQGIENNYTPLMISCLLGNEKIINLLILKGANVNAKDSMGESALAKSALYYNHYKDFKKIAQVFLDAGYHVDNQSGIGDNKTLDKQMRRFHYEIRKNYKEWITKQLDKEFDRYRSFPTNNYPENRESTAKGSIGHDMLNVKTISKSDWEDRLRFLGIEYRIFSEILPVEIEYLE